MLTDKKQINDYKGKITELIGSIHNTSVSTKIIQFMQRVRNNSDERYALRWISELLQNTRDCAYKDQKVKIIIELTNNQLIYKHNSMPFKVKDILSLINQVTSKIEKDEKDENTGKFGTGFMTTMLLSDSVRIESVLKDENLPYKPFNIIIDRSPDDPNEIIEKINIAIHELYKADNEKEINNFDRTKYNTIFTYDLKYEKSKNAALIGILNLMDTVPYIFAFSPKFEDIKIKVSTRQNNFCKEFNREDSTKILDNIEEIKIKDDDVIKRVLMFHSGDIFLATMCDENKNFLPINSKKISKLFINFPLIGTENFPFPIVINSPKFLPNEPRSNIALVNNEDSKDSCENRKLITEGVRCYGLFLEKLIELKYGFFENFIKISKYIKNSEHDENFVKNLVYDNLLKIIKNSKIVKCENGEFLKLNDDKLYFPYSNNNETRKKLKYLLKTQNNKITYPVEPDDWKYTLEGYNFNNNEIKFISLEDYLYDINKDFFYNSKNTRIKGSFNSKIYNKFLDVTDDQTSIEWFQNLFDLAIEDENLKEKIILSKYKIFPCQIETNISENIKEINNIYCDPGIPEFVKKICDKFDVFCSKEEERINIRKFLLSEKFNLRSLRENINGVKVYDINIIKSKIKEYISPQNFSEDCNYPYNWKKKYEIAKDVLSFQGNKKIISFINMLKSNDCAEIMEEYEIEVFDEDTYSNALNYCLSIITCFINNLKNINNFSLQNLLKKKENIFDFLNQYYKYLYDFDYQMLRSYKVVPNLGGNFKTLRELRGNGIKENELYLICKDLCKSFDHEIIHEKIKLPELDNYLTDKNIGDEINQFYVQIFSVENKDINKLNQDKQAISITLFDWMQDHPESTQKYLPFFKTEENRVRLLNLKVVNNLHEDSKKYKEITNIMEECGLSKEDLQDLQKIKNKLKSLKSLEELEPLLTNYKNGNNLAFANNDIDDEYFKNKSSEYIANENICINIEDLDNETKEKYNQAYKLRNRETFAVIERQILQMIGDAGEIGAFQQLKEDYKKRDYILKMENNNEIMLHNNKINESIFIKLCNDNFVKQPGYDILVKINRNGEEKIKYYEIKTHTKNSIKKEEIKLSYQQFKLYREKKNDFIVMMMTAYNVGNSWIAKEEIRFDPFYNYEGKNVIPENMDYVFHYINGN